MMKGIGSSEGYGIGRVLTIKEINLEFTPKDNCVPSEELKRYKEAVDRFCRKTEKTAERIKLTVGQKEAEIISGHILMIRDPYMNGEIEKLIENGQCAESALVTVCDMFSMVFSSADDELTKQRATDVIDKIPFFPFCLERKKQIYPTLLQKPFWWQRILRRQ